MCVSVCHFIMSSLKSLIGHVYNFRKPSVRGMIICRLDFHIFSRFQDINERVFAAWPHRLWLITFNCTFWRQNFECDVNWINLCFKHSRYANFMSHLKSRLTSQLTSQLTSWFNIWCLIWISIMIWKHIFESIYIKL